VAEQTTTVSAMLPATVILLSMSVHLGVPLRLRFRSLNRFRGWLGFSGKVYLSDRKWPGETVPAPPGRAF